jgi:hypothetical protein
MNLNEEIGRQKALMGIVEKTQRTLNKSFNLTENDVEDIFEEEWSGVDLDNSEIEDVKNSIRQLMSNNFSFNENGLLKGIENFPSEIILYRLISLNKSDDLKTNQLGTHWVLNKNILKNELFQGQIAIGYNNVNQLYIIEAVFGKKAIDPVETIKHHLTNDIEHEITTYKNVPPIRFKIDKYELLRH